MSKKALEVFVNSFVLNSFKGVINWYRKLDLNRHIMASIKTRIEHPICIIYGEKDVIPKLPTLNDFAPDLTMVSVETGRHNQREEEVETNGRVLSW